MSDYEGDWEPVKPQVNAIVPSIPPEPTHNYIVPKGSSLLEAQRAARQKPRRRNVVPASLLPKHYRPTLQAIHNNGYHRQALFRVQEPLPQQTSAQLHDRVLQLAAKKRFDENRTVPDSTYTLMHSLKVMAKHLPARAGLSPDAVVDDELAQLCLSTDAFIAIPLDRGTQDLPIWGTSHNISMAREHLRTWEMHVKAPGKAKGSGWTKVQAHDGREAHRSMLDNLEVHQQQTFLQSADDLELAFEVNLVWPQGYDLEDFISKYDENILKRLGTEFHCKISHIRQGLRVTRVSCDDQQNIFHVYARLMGLVKEMVARSRPGITETQCRLPSAEAFKDRVTMQKVVSYGSTMYVPKLVGNPLPAEEQYNWSQLSSEKNKKFRLATKTALRSCLRSVHASQKHTRMRAVFGEIALTSFERPANGQDFKTDDFIPMVRQDRIRALPLPLSVGPEFDFIKRLSTFEQFGPPEYSWALHFEFQGDQNKKLRLEREYSYNYIDPEEPSVSATRWLEINSDETQDPVNLLQLNQIDLEKLGLQMRITSESIYQNDRVLQGLFSFANNITFKRPLNGLQYEPSKHAIFPHGQSTLLGAGEITYARYKFKDTKGTFEIRRVDTFLQKPHASTVPVRTTWYANYYYQEWDTLMSQFANIVPGQNVDWKRDLHTFFPKTVDEEHPKILPNGFKTFMKEVEEIQSLLTQAVRQPSHATIDGTYQSARVGQDLLIATDAVNGNGVPNGSDSHEPFPTDTPETNGR